MDDPTRDAIHSMWDKLADRPQSKSDSLLKFLFTELGQLIDCQHGYWLSGLRISDASKDDDPLEGWRPGPIYYFNARATDMQAYKRAMQTVKRNNAKGGSFLRVPRAGKFRASLLKDRVPPDYFESDYYKEHYLARGIRDGMFVAAPVNRDTEVYYTFHRFADQPLFDKAQREIVSYALRSLKWLNRQALLSYGLLVADKPLTPTERKVINLLLTEKSEKAIAADLDQSPKTTHKHVTSIYRKFDVTNRAGLSALWLGHSS